MNFELQLMAHQFTSRLSLLKSARASQFSTLTRASQSMAHQIPIPSKSMPLVLTVALPLDSRRRLIVPTAVSRGTTGQEPADDQRSQGEEPNLNKSGAKKAGKGDAVKEELAADRKGFAASAATAAEKIAALFPVSNDTMKLLTQLPSCATTDAVLVCVKNIGTNIKVDDIASELKDLLGLLAENTGSNSRTLVLIRAIAKNWLAVLIAAVAIHAWACHGAKDSKAYWDRFKEILGVLGQATKIAKFVISL